MVQTLQIELNNFFETDINNVLEWSLCFYTGFGHMRDSVIREFQIY